MNAYYKNTYGTWVVKTCSESNEIFSVNLGTFTGHVDEIALHLADKCNNTLSFKLATRVKKFIPKKESVSIKFDIESNTWDMHGHELLIETTEIFSDRPVSVVESYSGGYFEIKLTNEDDLKRIRALAKLSPEEKKVLGLKG